MTGRGERKPNLWRCTETEMRNGYRTVRCTLHKDHPGAHQHRNILFEGMAVEVIRMNEEPVCGRAWTPREPLDGMSVRDGHYEDENAWVDLDDGLTRTHVCYRERGHIGSHRCWDGAQAEEKRTTR